MKTSSHRWVISCKFWIIAAIIAFPILISTLVVTNLRWAIGAEKVMLLWFEHVRRGVGGDKQNTLINDSLILVDVHNDKIMQVLKDEDGLDCGNEPVVNHSHLYRLLRELSNANNYRYIMLDVFLDKEVRQSGDSVLYQLIASMPRIVVARTGKEMADSCLNKKAGYAKYGTTLWDTDFIKYSFWIDGKRSMSLMMYEELNHRKIGKHGRFLMENDNIIRTSTILTCDVVEDEKLLDRRFFLDMMVSIPADEPIFNSLEDTRDKYILIGDFTDDRHNTYLGEMSGTMINFNAYKSLQNGHHRISWCILLFLYAIYILLVYITIHHNSFASVVMFIGYPIILIAACLGIYIYTNQVYDVLWTTLIFYLLEKVVYIWNKRQDIIDWIVSHYHIVVNKLN